MIAEWLQEEEECGQRLVLRRGAHLLTDRQMRQKGVDLELAHLGGVPQAVEVVEARPNPDTPQPSSVSCDGPAGLRPSDPVVLVRR